MKTSLKNNRLTLLLEGRIDSNNASAFEREIMAAVNEAPEAEIVIDAENLSYISSAGLRVLLGLLKYVEKPLQVLNLSPEVYDIFEVTGFTKLLNAKKRLREISVEGCEEIGSGAYGRVYRLDAETIAKLYSPFIGLAVVERERDISQKAFLMGIPTAISYDVVRCGDCYGVVYELLDAKTLAQVISEAPDRVPEIAGRCATLLKDLHRIVPGADSGLGSRKDELLQWVDSISEHLTAAEADTIRDFISRVPDRNTFLHGDFNFKNIMLRDDTFQIIDIGDASLGHPAFDLGMVMQIYIIMPDGLGKEKGEAEVRRMLGYDPALAPEVWRTLCGTYFGLSSPGEIDAMTQKLMPYALLWNIYHRVNRCRGNSAMLKAIVDTALRGELLPAIE